MLNTLIEATVTTFFIIGCTFVGCSTYHEYGHLLDGKTSEEYMFEKIANHVADDYEYNVNVFDCTEFSEELYNRLQYAGYEDIKIKVGCQTINKTSELADFDNCHAWVVLTLGPEEIYIESTSGEIRTKSYYANKFPAWNYIEKSTIPQLQWESTDD